MKVENPIETPLPGSHIQLGPVDRGASEYCDLEEWFVIIVFARSGIEIISAFWANSTRPLKEQHRCCSSCLVNLLSLAGYYSDDKSGQY